MRATRSTSDMRPYPVSTTVAPSCCASRAMANANHCWVECSQSSQREVGEMASRSTGLGLTITSGSYAQLVHSFMYLSNQQRHCSKLRLETPASLLIFVIPTARCLDTSQSTAFHTHFLLHRICILNIKAQRLSVSGWCHMSSCYRQRDTGRNIRSTRLYFLQFNISFCWSIC